MKYLNVVAALLLLAIYSLGSIPPSERFNLWLASFVIPFALVVNVLLVVAGILFRKKTTILLLAVLVYGADYLYATVGIKSLFRFGNPPKAQLIKVLNYNLSAFNTMDAGRRSESAVAERTRMLDWVLHSPSDVQCFQEFPDHPERNGIDMLSELDARGWDYYFSAATNKWDGSRFGTLIVSRLPIVRSGDVMASENGFNRISFADIVAGADTVRIVNVHLQSMQMKGFHPRYAETLEDGTHDVRVVLRKLKSGVFERSKQIRELIAFVEASPYPVICAGDFNELPYSYSYQSLREHLKNAFEESGRGFGFTYNGNTLSMLRIDNQFYSPSLKCVGFQTLDTVRFTDHFPVVGGYVFGGRRLTVDGPW